MKKILTLALVALCFLIKTSTTVGATPIGFPTTNLIKNMYVTNVTSTGARFHFTWDSTWIPEQFYVWVDIEKEPNNYTCIFNKGENYTLTNVKYGENSFVFPYTNLGNNYKGKKIYWTMSTSIPSIGMSLSDTIMSFNPSNKDVFIKDSKIGTNKASFLFKFTGIDSSTTKSIKMYRSNWKTLEPDTETFYPKEIISDSNGFSAWITMDGLEPNNDYFLMPVGIFNTDTIRIDSGWGNPLYITTKECGEAHFDLFSKIDRSNGKISCRMSILYPKWIQYSYALFEAKIEVNGVFYSSITQDISLDGNGFSSNKYLLSDTVNFSFFCSDSSVVKIKTWLMGPCGDISQEEFTLKGISTTGLKEMEINNLKIFPNPCTNSFTISLSSNTNEKVTLSSVEGKIVWNKEITGEEIVNTESLQKGIYFLTFENEVGKTTKKILIE